MIKISKDQGEINYFIEAWCKSIGQLDTYGWMYMGHENSYVRIKHSDTKDNYIFNLKNKEYYKYNTETDKYIRSVKK